MPSGEEIKRASAAPRRTTAHAEAVPQSAIAEELRRKLCCTAAQLAAKKAELGAAGEELRLSLDEARLLADNLESTSAALARANAELERQLAEMRAELQAAKAALRTGEEHMRLIFESATEYAILTLDLEGRITSWNPGARQILGFEEGEILGQPGDIIFTPEDRAEGWPAIEMCRAAEERRARDERWHVRADGSRFWAAGMMMPLLDAEGELQGFLKILRDHTERRRQEEQRSLQVRELDHRVKNTLASVQSIVAQTARTAADPAAFQADLDLRLKALARAHDMLSRNGWEGASLREVVERTLEPYAADGGAVRFSAEGPPVRLLSHMAATLNLALHELATNAAKYGALSTPGGHVEVVWELEQRASDEAPVALISWRERGGPPVQPPKRRGFGSRLLERALPYQSRGEVTLDFAPEGVKCRIRLPLAPPSSEKADAS